MLEKIPMTPAGYDNLARQLEELKTRRVTLSKAIGEAREKGDLKENAEYHAAREDQGMNEAKIRELEDKLARSYIVRTEKTGVIQFGSKVTVLDLDGGFEEEFSLVGAGEEDYTENKILTTSPIGAALLSRCEGEEIEFEAPAGIIRFRILTVE